MTEKKKQTTEKTFRDLGIADELADALEDKGIVHPFPIQELTLPMALKGADIIGQARTGTGKTLGFGLPLLHRIDTAKDRTQALIIVPTRELCVQVASDLEIGSRKGITSIAVYGGMPIEPQTEKLAAGVHVVVGTPGRLLDHLNRGNLDLTNVTELVLDEADEMLDMGFLPDVERLIEASNSEGRHTMLFSATMPASIVSLARRYMSHPTFMRAEMEESDVAPTVDQHFFLVHRMDKPRVLARILQSPERGGVYVFTRTKNMADRLVKELEELKVNAIAIHGDLRQSTRQKNLDTFREGKADVLVATEVAARGLDVENVTHVVNYDCPDDDKMYLHRIGRTARAGAKGVAITFAQFNEVDRLNVIRKAVDATEHQVEEVFSTSDRLQELFDLPDETPWAHLSKKVARAKPAKPSGGRGDEKKASSDGRSKNKRSSEGRGEERSSNRDRTRDRSEDRTRSKRRDADGSGGESRQEDTDAAKPRGTTEDSSSRDRSSTRDRGGDGSSARTRTRTRGASDDDQRPAKERPAKERPAKERPEAKSEPEGETKGSDDRPRSRNGRDGDSSSKSSSSGRTRARARKRAGSSGGSDDGASKEEAGSRSRDRSSKEDPSKGDRSSKSAAKSDRSGRSRKGDSKGGRRDDRPEKGSSSSREDAGSRGGSSNRGSSRVDVARALRGNEEKATTRGEDARGDGAPSFSRRVKVEHLP